MLSASTRRTASAARALLSHALAMLLLAMVAQPAWSQDYPSRLIHIVVPYTPGTGYDSIARIVSPPLAERLGQQIVVENMPGASSTIGAAHAAKAAADGYTLLMIGEGTMASMHLYKDLSFDVLRDFTPITLAGTGTLLLATNPKTGLHTVADLVGKAKAAPGKYTYASPGVGTSQNLKMEMFCEAAGIKLLHVPYKGSAGALNDLLAGVVDVGLVPVHQALAQVTAGKLVPMAVVSPRRSTKLPNVPTLGEAGIQGVDAVMWYAFVAPKGTPPAIVTRLNSELREVIALPQVRHDLEKIGLEVKTSTPQELTTIMRNESDSAARIISASHLSIK